MSVVVRGFVIVYVYKLVIMLEDIENSLRNVK